MMAHFSSDVSRTSHNLFFSSRPAPPPCRPRATLPAPLFLNSPALLTSLNAHDGISVPNYQSNAPENNRRDAKPLARPTHTDLVTLATLPRLSIPHRLLTDSRWTTLCFSFMPILPQAVILWSFYGRLIRPQA